MQSQLQAVARGLRLRRQRELFEHIEILGALQFVNELYDAGIIACHRHLHRNLCQTPLLEVRFPERLPLGFQTCFLRKYPQVRQDAGVLLRHGPQGLLEIVALLGNLRITLSDLESPLHGCIQCLLPEPRLRENSLWRREFAIESPTYNTEDQVAQQNHAERGEDQPLLNFEVPAHRSVTGTTPLARPELAHYSRTWSENALPEPLFSRNSRIARAPAGT